MYGKLVDGKLMYAKEYFVCEDGSTIINFNNNEKLMMAYGFKPVVNEIPEYDVENEYVTIKRYVEKERIIVINYEIKQIVKTQKQLKEEEKEKCLKMFAQTLTDEQALQVPLMFDEWNGSSRKYIVGERMLYNSVLYKVLIEHTSQETWTPDVSPSLFAKVINETVDGSIPEWVQPDSTNAYSTGDRVLFEGSVYVTLINNNVWSPTAYPAGWKLES